MDYEGLAEPVIKLCDFGLTRGPGMVKPSISSRKYTTEVCTIWYRPPELLSGRQKTNVQSWFTDIWSVGCVLVEAFSGKVLFKGDGSEVSQLALMLPVIGNTLKCGWCKSINIPVPKNLPIWDLHKGVNPQIQKIVEKCIVGDYNHRQPACISLKELNGELTPFSTPVKLKVRAPSPKKFSPVIIPSKKHVRALTIVKNYLSLLAQKPIEEKPAIVVELLQFTVFTQKGKNLVYKNKEWKDKIKKKAEEFKEQIDNVICAKVARVYDM